MKHLYEKIPIKKVYEGLWDGPHATPKESEHGPIFLGIKNITDDGHLDFSSVRHISENDFPKWTKRVVPQAGDIVFTYEATLHRYAILPKGFRGCLGRRVALIRPNKYKVDTLYLLYYFLGNEWREEVSKYMILGATVDRIPLIEFPDFEIHLPPLHTQRKIGTILSAYDYLIENNTRRIQILEEMAQAIYRQWFMEYKYPGSDGLPLVSSGTELGNIPDGWEIKTLGQICDLKRERFIKENHLDLPLLDLARMKSKTIYIDDTGTPDELCTSRIVFREDDVLFGSIRPYLHKVVLAPCMGVTNTSVVVLRATNVIYKNILAILMSSENTIRWADQQSTGTKMPIIKWENLKTMLTIVPPDSLLYQFNRILDPVLETVKLGYYRNRNLRVTRDLLLPKLISGELDISKLERPN